MRFKNLDLNLLAALDKLIRLRSVSRAAEELSITQSAMSNALNRLRQHFDDPLLVQVGRRMELTPRAIALEQPVRDILVRIDAAVATPPGFEAATSSRRIGLMVSDYSLSTVVPPFLAAVARKAPSMRFDVKPQQSLPQLQLERGDTDLLIAPGIYCSPDHPSERLLMDPMVCVLDADHPAARDGLTMAAFLAAEHVVMLPPNAGESYAARVLREAGLAVQVAVTSFSFASLPDLVRSTRRIALVQARLARRMARLGGLAVLDPPLDLPPLEQRIQWHSIRGQDPALAWLRSELHASIAADRG
ncbi:LysR family transcriptional regulator [Aquibium microcysteis]|uniref:LysR family transcriptional regulator n=1 Tax=Aquibium microcysteis TaxID=675281 RepID=UPI00165D1588|nr:LysR family transcriptional regulator [Aquibium microcysteis]